VVASRTPSASTGSAHGTDLARARAALERVLDPELPVLSIVELGIVRDVVVEGRRVAVTLTPTYSGCPAMHAIEAEVGEALRGAGFDEVELRTVYAPAWTTDWIAAPAREKLRAHGIAPPGPRLVEPLVQLESGRASGAVACPYCGSSHTTVVSHFGATACTALHSCHACRHPFEHFKPF
jgi:ring-1,2-phenylacetyl-CoA epoxidase subunit PaaD